jgi:CRP/FNR family transcriptional regulator, anaerobic regulatory protein
MPTPHLQPCGPAGSGASTATGQCAACPIRHSALCATMADGDLAAFRRSGRRQTIERGETVFWAGEDSLVCGNLTAGVLKLTASTPDGREQIVGLLYPGDFVGSLFEPAAGYSVTALTDAELCVFPRREYQRMLEENTAASRFLLKRTLSDLDRVRDWMLLLGRKCAQEKLAAFLLETARRVASDEHGRVARGQLFELPLTRQGIADVLGLTIETVSRQMTKLKTEGFISVHGNRHIAIEAPGELADLAEAA